MNPEIPIESFKVFATGLDHPDGLAFDRHGDLWAGGEAGQIYRISSQGRVETVANVGAFCGGLAFSPADTLFVCCPGLGVVAVEATGEYSVFATHAGGHKMICPNYGVFDSAGNYFVTDSGNWRKGNGHLLRFTPDGKSAVMGGPYGYASGLALSADERSLFMAESNTGRVFRFELAVDGSVVSHEIYAEECGRFPEGLSLDAEGNLYVSCHASDEIHRISPVREKTLLAWDGFSILLGSPANMAFGGANFDEMFVANLARTTITRAIVERKGQPLANQKVKKKLRPRPSAL